MSIRKHAISAVLGIATSGVMAAEFDGPFVQLGIGGSRSYTNLSRTRNGILDGTSSQGNVNGLVAGGYSRAIGQSGFNLAANLFYVIGNQNAGAPNNTLVGSNGSSSASTSSTFANSFGIALEPGWYATERTLGYAKLAWVNTNGLFKRYAREATLVPSVTVSESTTTNKNMNGLGYGVGVKQRLTQDLYLSLDVMGVAYRSVTTNRGAAIRPEQFMGFMSLGYCF